MEPKFSRLPWDFLVAIFLGSGIAGWIMLAWIQLHLDWGLTVAVFLYTFVVILVLEASTAMESAGFTSMQTVWALIMFATASYALGALTSIVSTTLR